MLDGHYSHARDLYLIKLGRELYVSVLFLPTYSTHKMWSLDLSFNVACEDILCS